MTDSDVNELLRVSEKSLASIKKPTKRVQKALKNVRKRLAKRTA